MPRKLLFILVAILLVGAGLRLYGLDRGDPISDEVFYGFRAIGMLDFDFSADQPTTLQLLEDRGSADFPWWTTLSFHDHPPLVFLTQHLSMRVFGDTLWGMRVPSAIFGVLSVWLVYVIGRRLFSEYAGIVAAAVFASNVLALYASRVGVQESQVIFFVLLTVYCFLRATESESLSGKRWYVFFGAALGLAFLSKYTALFVIVPLALYSILQKPRAIDARSVWYAGAVALVFASPVFIYNAMLYATFGHFDFQLSHILGQNVPYWQEAPGKEIGNVGSRFTGIFFNLWNYASPAFTSVSGFAVAAIAAASLRRRKGESRPYIFVLLLIGCTALLFLLIGSSPRFLTMLIPWLSLAVGVCAVYVFDFIGRFASRRTAHSVLVLLVVVFVSWESVYSVNSAIAVVPLGSEVVHYSKIHGDMHVWGFNELDEYMEDATRSVYPERTVPYKYTFLERIRNRAILNQRESGASPSRTLFMYNDAMSDIASLWVFSRRSLYRGTPIVTADKYREVVASEGENFYREGGFNDFYFIHSTRGVLPRKHPDYTPGDEFEDELIERGIVPSEIVNPQGAVAFRIYHFK